MTKSDFILAATMAGLAGIAFAQQPAQTSTTINGKTIAIKYSAPSMKGRKIFGGVAPYGKVWRIGDNSAVAFHTDVDLVFKGATVPKGDYTLYVLPDAGAWQLIVNKQTGPKALTHNPKMDVGRVPMILSKAPAPVETCKVTITKTAARAAKLEIAWENTIGSAAFHLDRVAGDSEW